MRFRRHAIWKPWVLSAALLPLLVGSATAIEIDNYSSGPIVVQLDANSGLEFADNQTDIDTLTGQRRIVMSAIPKPGNQPWSVRLQISDLADIADTNASGVVTFQYGAFDGFDFTEALTNTAFLLGIEVTSTNLGPVGQAVVALTTGGERSEITKLLFPGVISNIFAFNDFNLAAGALTNFVGLLDVEIRSDQDSSFRLTRFAAVPFLIPEPSSVFICSLLAIFIGLCWRLRRIASR
jgi:hypothetical protein